MAYSLGDDDFDPYPVRQAGETLAQYAARVGAWQRRNPGRTASSYDIGDSWTAAPGASGIATLSVGMPSPAAKFAPYGEQLGAFSIAGPAAMPVSTRSSVSAPSALAQAGRLIRLDPMEWGGERPPDWGTHEAPPPLRTIMPVPSPGSERPPYQPPYRPGPPGEGGSPPWFFAPGGAVTPGLREPRDPTPEELESQRLQSERSEVLSRTQFDTAWGVPPSAGAGLQWSSTKFVYEPTKEPEGAPYRYAASVGVYTQPYMGGAVQAGYWGTRWVDVTKTPYRILPASERSVWDLEVQSAKRLQASGKQGSGKDALGRTIEVPLRPWEKEGGLGAGGPLAPFPNYGAPPKKFNLGDYAWVEQRTLPVECPYPYPYMPVPQADYSSGAWLSPDYVPSIPLPPPYDAVPWQCGVHAQPAEPIKSRGGGDGPPPSTPVIYNYAYSDTGGGDGGTSDPGGTEGGGLTRAQLEVLRARREQFDVGLPTPTGSAAPPDEVEAARAMLAQKEEERRALLRKAEAGGPGAAEAAQKAARLLNELKTLASRIDDLVRGKKAESGEDGGYSTWGMPPAPPLPGNVLANPNPDPPPGNPPPSRAQTAERGRAEGKRD